MGQPSTLRKIKSFGKIDAESEFRPDFFVPSSSWSNVCRREHPILVGRKGTGKTAIRLKLLDLAESEPLTFVADLTFRDYPWRAHEGVYDAQVAERSRYLETWVFLILVELAKLAVGRDQAQPVFPDRDYRDTVEALREFVVANWGELQFDHKEVFRSSEYKLAGRRLRPQVGGISAGELEWTRVPRERLGDSLRSANGWLKDALARTLREDALYYIVFDELGLDFERSSKAYKNSLVGLLLAAQHVHQWAKTKDLTAGAVVLLQDDIYDVLEFSEKNKLTHSLVERIVWSSDRGTHDSLKTIIDVRIRAMVGGGGVSGADPWRGVFEADGVGGRHIYDYIVDRTYLRPRDLIQFANLSLTAARRSKSPMITAEHVEKSAERYGELLVRELSDEISPHFPEWKKWLDLLRRVGQVRFTRKDFESLCEESNYLTGGARPETILQSLFQFSVIGYSRLFATPVFARSYWRYKDPDVTFDQSPDHYVVHPGLKDYLGLSGETDDKEYIEQRRRRTEKRRGEKVRQKARSRRLNTPAPASDMSVPAVVAELRRMVRTVLMAAFPVPADAWEARVFRCLPPELSRALGDYHGGELMSRLDAHAMRFIIQGHWRVFQPVFGDLDETTEAFLALQRGATDSEALQWLRGRMQLD